jgi:hypothetical protein
MRRLSVFAAILAVLMVSTMGTAGAADTFSIRGDVDGLYPGFDGTLDTQVTNTLDVPIRVMQVSGAPVRVDPAACDPTFVAVETTHTSVDLAPGQSGVVPLHITMSAAAPDACQGASFRIVFRGTSLAQDRQDGTLAFTGHRTDVVVICGLTLLFVGLVFVRRGRKEVLR